MATYHFTAKAGSKGKGASASIHAEYILRLGKYSNRGDLGSTGFGNMPVWACDNPVEFWRTADLNERQNGVVYREHELALPLEASLEEQIAIIENWCQKHYNNHAYLYAIHIKEGNPHCHIMICDRRQDGIERGPELYFKRQASSYRDWKTKELKKSDPAKGGCPKSEFWNGKDRDRNLVKLRKSWAAEQNRFYQSKGLDVRVDHRSLKEQQNTALESIRNFEELGYPDLAIEEKIIFTRLDREPDRRVNHQRYRTMQRTGQLASLRAYRTSNREAAAAKAELHAARERRNNLYKQQQAVYATQKAAKQAEYERQCRYRSNRSAIRSTGRSLTYILPKPLGLAFEVAAEIMIAISTINDWRQSGSYRRYVLDLQIEMHKIKAERETMVAQITAQTNASPPQADPIVSEAQSEALPHHKMNKPSTQQPTVVVYGPNTTAAALLNIAPRITSPERQAQCYKLAVSVEKLPPGTIIYRGQVEPRAVELYNAAVVAVNRQLTHPVSSLSGDNGNERAKSVSLATVTYIKGYPSQIACKYREYIQQLNDTDPAKARTLTAICNAELSRVSNAREIVLPHPSADLAVIRESLKDQGITGGRKR